MPIYFGQLLLKITPDSVSHVALKNKAVRLVKIFIGDVFHQIQSAEFELSRHFWVMSTSKHLSCSKYYIRCKISLFPYQWDIFLLRSA